MRRASNRPGKPLTPADRQALGKEARARAARSSHADWTEPRRRRDPVEVLLAQNATREPELVPIRHGRMLASPFAFFRGSAAIMAGDLAATPRSGLEAQLCGDAHLANFGGFAAPDRKLVFDCNDFDETLPGPFEWDVKRLAASLSIAGRDRNFSRKERLGIVLASVQSYREAMRTFAEMRELEVWYQRFDETEFFRRAASRFAARRVERMRRAVDQAQGKNSLRALAKLTKPGRGAPRIIRDHPLITPVEDLAKGQSARKIAAAFEAMLAAFRASLQGDRQRLTGRYRFVHAARKVVGVGSVGRRAWIVLLLGRDPNDPLFLQAKEAEASVLEPYAGKSAWGNHGQRVVEGQRLMQATSDPFLGWLRGGKIDGEPRDYYVRQLWDGKLSVDISSVDPHELEIYARMCGWTLARAHARSGDRIAIASYLGPGPGFDHALAGFAEAYADQNERDHQALVEAVKSGRVKAKRDV
jgi:uncharacterized protein (DUF2252 family)